MKANNQMDLCRMIQLLLTTRLPAASQAGNEKLLNLSLEMYLFSR